MTLLFNLFYALKMSLALCILIFMSLLWRRRGPSRPINQFGIAQKGQRMLFFIQVRCRTQPQNLIPTRCDISAVRQRVFCYHRISLLWHIQQSIPDSLYQQGNLPVNEQHMKKTNNAYIFMEAMEVVLIMQILRPKLPSITDHRPFGKYH